MASWRLSNPSTTLVCGRRRGLRRQPLSMARDSLKGMRRGREGRGKHGTPACPCPPGASEPTERRDSPQPQRRRMDANTVRRRRPPLVASRDEMKRSPRKRLEADSVRSCRSPCGRRRNSPQGRLANPIRRGRSQIERDQAPGGRREREGKSDESKEEEGSSSSSSSCASESETSGESEGERQERESRRAMEQASCLFEEISGLRVRESPSQEIESEEQQQQQQQAFPYMFRERTNRTPNHLPRENARGRARPKPKPSRSEPTNKDSPGPSQAKNPHMRPNMIKLKSRKRVKAKDMGEESLPSRRRSRSETSSRSPSSQSETVGRQVPPALTYTHRLRPRAPAPAPHRQAELEREAAAITERGRKRKEKTLRGQNEVKEEEEEEENDSVVLSCSGLKGGRRGGLVNNGKGLNLGRRDDNTKQRKRKRAREEEESNEELVERVWSREGWKRNKNNRTTSAEIPIVVHYLTRQRRGQLKNPLPNYRGSSSSSSSSDSSIFHLGPNPSSFESLFTLGSMLGKGGCGAVYAAMRKSDGQQVAIKYVNRGMAEPYVKLPGQRSALPLEVALMQIVSRPPSCCYVLGLLDWFEEAEWFILVLERPYPCMDLFDFIEELGGRVDECLARIIMIQVVLAVRHCCDRGVLHRDVKAENLLVQTDNLQVKLIDFGCGDLLRESSYRDYSGTEEYCPPEWVLSGVYQGRHATIWSLGVLLYGLVCGRLPFNKEADIIAGRLRFKKGLTKECKELINWCLQQNPTKRPVLEQILLHDWMAEGQVI
ncbi:serine/arginine repetitive matrix protein 2 isoform X2 [Coregonus clupeaformis]|uniref:serine/arginine repetitive matrix protein 2 isoform X2 n=1 Tax=Coregonus clupeaformis TaxID=59861 RepID=UPI001E1C6706|nr:serine/arginine repetitive matrix protein 2 isoform X2 [Coregonus clupeaformis]